MMISTKFIFPLVFVLVVFISLSDTIEIADGFSASGNKIVYQMNPGETQVQTWLISNAAPEPLTIQFYVNGIGSEFLHFEELVTMAPNERTHFEFIAVIPDDHADNIEYRIEVFALKRSGELAEGDTGIAINYQMATYPRILIGDNPIYTAPVILEIAELPESKVPKEKDVVVKEKVIEETLEEKLARINASNDEFTVDDVEKDVFIDESVYEPEPEMDVQPVVTPVILDESSTEEGGGCLIATATFGSELAPQVQLLREIRDNQLMISNSGIAFMSGFNQLYYSFSPYIADLERESPIFKEIVKLSLTPMLSTLSVMEHADSESKVLGLGIGVILMNLGMYVGLPTFGIVKLIQFRKN